MAYQAGEQGIIAPELEGGYWLQGGPLTMAGLRGRPVLVDFWDYTCINCLRTLPYLVEWHRRYSPYGLVIVGVHTPEFSFARRADDVRRAIAEFGIEYPVVMDNDYAIWRAYNNRYWPAKYLVDAQGRLRYYHFGEGTYESVERALQHLLREVQPDLVLPEPMPPVRDEDRPGAVCYRVTPEVYLGFLRGSIGNPTGFAPKRPANYRDPGLHAEGFFYLEGPWVAEEECVYRPWDALESSRLYLRYTAREVNVVMNPMSGQAGRLDIWQDGAPIPAEDAAADVRWDENGQSYVAVDVPRMYRLVANRDVGHHELSLSTSAPGMALYAFTFVSCAIPGWEMRLV
jgi:thiol-disulfide isomerase/thioredoxin